MAAVLACGLALTVIIVVAAMSGNGLPRDKEIKRKSEGTPDLVKKDSGKEAEVKGVEKEPPPPPPPDGLPHEFVNTAGGKMIYVKGGKFRMGSPETEKDRNNEKQHWVTVSDFYIAATEVTQGQFEKVMNYNPSWFTRSGKDKNGAMRPGGGADKLGDITDTTNFPVENVSSYEAEEYCRRLNEEDKSRPSGWVFRLPTEAEWEYSCRGETVEYQIFHFGNVLNNSRTQANFNGTYPYGSDAPSEWLKRTRAVGSYPANRFGLKDMHGNVREWCDDWCAADYYHKSDNLTDPRGPKEGEDRVLRGGSWDDLGVRCRSAWRGGDYRSSRNKFIGFRVALVPQERR